MLRAFKFLNRTSVSCGAVDVGAGDKDEERAGEVLTGDAVAVAPATGATGGGVSSCANETETLESTMSEMQSEDRVIRRKT